jgi:hypothetical protein
MKKPRLIGTIRTSSVGILLMSVGWGLSQLHPYVLHYVDQEISVRPLFHMVLVLAVLLVLALSWAFSLRDELKNPTSSQFDFDEYGGYYIVSQKHGCAPF